MKLKKVISVALMAAMTMTLMAGCGSKPNDQTGSSGDGEVFKIGGIGPVTGGAAVYGGAGKNGAGMGGEKDQGGGGNHRGSGGVYF